jgi:hypothetical protein
MFDETSATSFDDARQNYRAVLASRSGRMAGHTKKLLSEFCEGTTVPGIPKVAGSPYLLMRIFWAVILLASCGVCTWQIYELIIMYFTYPVNVVIEVGNQLTFSYFSHYFVLLFLFFNM